MAQKKRTRRTLATTRLMQRKDAAALKKGASTAVLGGLSLAKRKKKK